jgi:hypothetical protein
MHRMMIQSIAIGNDRYLALYRGLPLTPRHHSRAHQHRKRHFSQRTDGVEKLNSGLQTNRRALTPKNPHLWIAVGYVRSILAEKWPFALWAEFFNSIYPF